MYSNRISTTARYNLLTDDIKKNEAAYNRAMQQVASGKRVVSISDDPIAAVNIVNTNRQLGQIETFAQNIGLGMSELSTMDDLLDVAGGYLSKAWDKDVQANSGTYGENSLKALKVEIDEITKTMVDLANTEFNDAYIFGGANTKLTPYTIDNDGNVIYNGTPHENPDYQRKTEVADGVFETINTTGDKVFGWFKNQQATDSDGNKLFTDASGKQVTEYDDGSGNKSYKYADGTAYTGDVADLTEKQDSSGVFAALGNLSKAIQEVIDAKEAGDQDAETAGYKKMNATLDMFSNALTQMTNEQTKFGGVYNRLEMTESTLETNNENLTSYLSEIQDVDYADAISRWYQAQYAYQASLQVAAQSMGMSLLNYI